MAFYKNNQQMQKKLRDVLEQFAQEGRETLLNNIAISWIRYDNAKPVAGSGIGAGWSQHKLFYPASVVKLIYAIAIEVWLEKNLIVESGEMRRALKNMISVSSNDATSFIVDLLTGTCSGPSIIHRQWENWKSQRGLINKWLQSLDWEELKGINCCQKTWSDSPYGRDKDFYGNRNENRNSLSTEATSRIFEALMTYKLISAKAAERIKKYLFRTLDLIERKENPENEIDGFLGEGLPQNTKLWSKAGLMSEARNDAIWSVSEDGYPMLLVVFTKGKQLANDNFLLPALAGELSAFNDYKGK